MPTVSEKLLMLALLQGNLDTEDAEARLTVKGFAMANIVTARVVLEGTESFYPEDIKELIKYLKDAESAIDMLNDNGDYL